MNTKPLMLVYILGSGHCGSTLLDLMLDRHSQICGVGEMQLAAPETQCTCGKAARECPFWQHALGDELSSRRNIYRPKPSFFLGGDEYRYTVTGEPVDTEEFVRTRIAAYERIAAYSGKRIIVDSSKNPDRAALIAETSAPHVQVVVIHMVRDGRAVTWSYIRKYGRLIPYFFTWFFSNIKIERLLRRIRWMHLYLRYEDLVDDPEGVMRKLSKKLGIEYEPAMRAFREGEHHQIGGNRMRFGDSTEISRDDAWRKAMPLYQKVLFIACFGWLNAWYMSKKSLQ